MREAGLTLIEFLIGFTILGILVTLSVPAYLDYRANASVRRVASDMQGGLLLSKSEAIKRNTNVSFAANGTGWVVSIPAIGLQPSIPIATRAAENSEASLTVTASATNLVFNSQGRTQAGGFFTLDISNPQQGTCASAGGNIRCLRIRVSPAGQIKLCDPALAAEDPKAC